jgi:hypothetical protein
MVSIGALWLPILLSAILVFVVTFLLWMVSPHHRTDWTKLEDRGVMAALKQAGLPPEGQYQFNQGRGAVPGEHSGFLILFKSNMPKSLPLSLFHNLVVSTAVAFVGARLLPPGSSFAEVFVPLAVVGALSYAGAPPANSIWFGRSWSSTLKEMFDGIVYGLVVAAVFAWLWPS